MIIMEVEVVGLVEVSGVGEAWWWRKWRMLEVVVIMLMMMILTLPLKLNVVNDEH